MNQKKLSGTVIPAPDKSISHRAVMLGSIANGVTHIKNFLMGEDCISTIRCFEKLGVKIEINENEVTVFGRKQLNTPGDVLDTGNSGTTTRLLTGLLSGYPIEAVVLGDESLNKRPMKRIITPLQMMGAQIKAREENFCPMHIFGKEQLKAISYTLPVASAQLKSALILASLHADGDTTLQEPALSRDHTENMLRAMGGKIVSRGTFVKVSPTEELSPIEIRVPGDISSAAFFIVGALIVPGSQILIKNVGMNPTRTGLLTVLKQMGADIKEENQRIVCNEPVADLIVKHSVLHGVEISGDIIASLIDEIPILAVAAAMAEGVTTVKDAKELRVKECDRIKAICEMLETVGISTREYEDGFSLTGTETIKGGKIESYYDHRIAMSSKILSLVAEEPIEITHFDCVNISFPNFLTELKSLIQN